MRHSVWVMVLCSVLFTATAVPARDRVVVVPLGGGRIPSPVAKTGQALCFNDGGDPIACAGTGQDGELQKGVPWPVPRFTDNGNGTVTDNLTGLVWLRNANCIGTVYPGYDRDGTFGDGMVTRQHALLFIMFMDMGWADCGDTSNGGSHQNDWRLPNRFELESILDIGIFNPADPMSIEPALPSGHPFLHVEPDFYWTSSYHSYYFDLGVGWAVHFSAGGVSPRSWNLEPCYAWPVRGGR